MSDTDLAKLTGAQVRARCRANTFDGPTCGVADGYAQANLVVVPQAYAAQFARFCHQNPKPCPLLEVLDTGVFEPRRLAPAADIRTDLPRYRVYRNGACVDRPTCVEEYCNQQSVAFLIGCSFTFEAGLKEASLPLRHIDEGHNVPMYRTNIDCTSSGPFGGPLVVSMRPMTPAQAREAARVTASYPHAHGAPVHVGDPAELGILNVDCPDYGEAVTIRDGEVPVFWACGVTPMEALIRSKIGLAITHEPGHMFLTDVSERDLCGSDLPTETPPFD